MLYIYIGLGEVGSSNFEARPAHQAGGSFGVRTRQAQPPERDRTGQDRSGTGAGQDRTGQDRTWAGLLLLLVIIIDSTTYHSIFIKNHRFYCAASQSTHIHCLDCITGTDCMPQGIIAHVRLH